MVLFNLGESNFEGIFYCLILKNDDQNFGTDQSVWAKMWNVEINKKKLDLGDRPISLCFKW